MIEIIGNIALIALGFALHWAFGRWLNRRKNANPPRAAAGASELIRHAARQDSFFNMVLGNIPCQVFIKDPLDGFKYKIANKNFTDYYQLQEENVVEHPDEDIFDPDVVRQLRSHDLEVCAHPGKVFRFDEDISFRRRGKEVFKSLKMCFETPDHHPYMLGVCVDITDLNKLIQLERINNEVLSQAVAESDFRKVVEVSAKTLKKELKCSRVIFLHSTKEGELKLFHEEYAQDLRPVAANGLENHEKLWDAHWTRLSSNELIAYDDFQAIAGVEKFLKIFPDYPTRSIAGVPIFEENRLTGALLISYCEPHVFRETDKAMLRSMSKIVTLAAMRDRQMHLIRQAEEENQALLDNISIPLWLYNTQGCIIQTNNAADNLLGHVDGRQSYDCRRLFGCGTDDTACTVRTVLKTHKPAHERCKYRGKNYLLETRPIMDGKNSALRGVVSSFYDVTELEAAISSRQSVNDCLANMVRENDMTQAIKKSIRDICEHLKALRCYIMQFDTGAKTVSCFLEYTHDESAVLEQIHHQPYSTQTDWIQCFMNQPLLAFPDRLSLDENPGLDAYREKFVRYNVQSVYAHRILLNGKVWGYVSALYEHEPHKLAELERDYIGSIAYCIELMLIRQQHQNKIFNALRKAEDADKAKSMFLASMSHEIRTPLNVVIGFSELLKGGTLPKQTENDYLCAISDAGNALLALINDVLDLSKLEAGQMVFTPSAVDFHRLVDEVGGIFRQKCNEKKLLFRAEVPDDIPAILLDKLRTRQLLFNLIGNAVKFTEHGAITVRAKFEPDGDRSGKLTFSVADTGIGISEEDQKRIFQMFVQGKALRGTQAERNGTGLGLAICKRMIEKMDGELLLASEPGKGSVFTVVLNRVIRENRTDSAETKPDAPEETETAGPLNVLVVDDVAMNLKVMTAMLLRVNPEMRILTAGNAGDALALLDKNRVDFVLTDLWMPGMNGAEFAAEIRRSKKYPELVVAAVTADVDGGENFDMSFFNAVLTKPVAIEKLHAFIGKFNKQHSNISSVRPISAGEKA